MRPSVGVIAQLVERRVRNAKVCGSIPHGSTIPSNGAHSHGHLYQ